MQEIRDLNKQIDFNNYKGKNDPKNFICFKGPLSFYRNITEGYITLEKAGEQQKQDWN